MTENIPNQFLTPICGNNFSGRTNYLKSMIKNNSNNVNKPNFIYIGEQPSNFISGIFPTVRNEFDLHSLSAGKDVLDVVKGLFTIYGFENHLDKNPFILSGGEQTILVVLCSLLLHPDSLAIDTTIEQLNAEWRLPLFEAIQQGGFLDTKVFLADNRLKEYQLNDLAMPTIKFEQTSHKYIFEEPILRRHIPSKDMSHSIELIDLTFAYSIGKKILDKVNVLLEPQNIYHLGGKNGAGKTTLAKLLTGILKLKSGKIKVDDKAYNAFKFPGNLVGYSFQNPDEQIFSSTVENEVLIHLKREPSEYTERREIYIEMFGLKSVRNCHPAELPFVMRKRISLAATLAMDRPWYILDEPTLGQDESFVEFLIALLNDLAENGKGVIVISHSKSFTEKLRGKYLTLTAGQVNNTNK